MVVVPLIMIWLDLRKQHREDRKLITDQAEENGKKFSRIETMLEPIWKWWNKSNNDH